MSGPALTILAQLRHASRFYGKFVTYGQHFSLRHHAALGNKTATDAVIRVYDEAGSVIETHEQAGEFKECFF